MGFAGGWVGAALHLEGGRVDDQPRYPCIPEPSVDAATGNLVIREEHQVTAVLVSAEAVGRAGR